MKQARRMGGEKLRKTLKPVLENGGIPTWFWGHEPRCVLYKPHLGVRPGRCIGHSGVPVSLWWDEDDGYKASGQFEHRGQIRDGLASWALCGFAVPDFESPRIDIRNIDETGALHKHEAIS